MASLANRIDPNAEAPGDFEIFEAGNYPLELTEADIKATKAGTGELLSYKIRITGGDLENRLVFGQLNISNPNEIAQKIGQSEFLALRTVVGAIDAEDTDELLFKEFVGHIKITPAKGEYKAKNEVDWGKTLKLFNGEAVAPVAANDNVAPPANAVPKPAAAKAAVGAPKKAWPAAKAA